MSSPVANIVHRIYDPLISYRSVKLNYYNEGETLSTQAQKAKKVCEQQKAFVYEDNPEGPKEEKIFLERVLCKVTPNKDGRERITNTTQWPNVVNAQLTMKFDGKTYCGSGAMVGPHHLLTCAHNVFDTDKKKFADSISVYAALNDSSAPFGEAQVTRVYVFSQWKKSER